MTVDLSPLIPFGPTLGFTVNPIDRLSGRRTDAAFLAALREAPDSRSVVLAGEEVMLDASGRPWFAFADLERHGEPQHHALLGRRDGLALFATALPPLPDGPGADRSLRDLRGIAVEGALDAADIGALAQAKALFHWHRHHRFCSHCSAATQSDQAGWRRVCPVCESLHFPRTDPVVIMMATQGDRCLLGRQPRFPPGMYSCLAGFVEPGETIEDAVRREIAEESGLVVGRVSYLGSQPWPFPASIMIGCIGEAETSDIRVDHDELEDARWFSRDETRAIMEGRHPGGIVCPQTMAIAHHLMRAWAYPP